MGSFARTLFSRTLLPWPVLCYSGQILHARFSNTSFARTLLGSNFGGLLLEQTFCRHCAAFPESPTSHANQTNNWLIRMLARENCQDPFSTPNPQVCWFYFMNLVQKEKSLLRKLSKGVKVLETAVGAVFAPTRFCLVRISIRDLVADGKSLVRNSGVGGGGQNLILKLGCRKWGCNKP